ncbi:acetyl-CoA C-acyltransferase [Allopusillimonas ginsengisoli]|uniref:acetyl-CoA C-acyltransferase n=1 Tax=Allopusillimonas ginsengisoli TaxID=453575 RepID=UPI00101F02A5|nr:acetyl-CoA C-acyltransferase [Allopusillimonas ginsengisoli]TEA77901.1 acetyl-CoA C-acyltransferase [Allopusillimonas ginsengisoli]
MLDAYIYDGIRSPFGKQAGALASMRPDDLLAQVFAKLLTRSGVDPAQLDDIVVGCANQAGEDSRCVARHAGLLAGLPVELGGTVVQRNCGSGLGALITAAHALTSGEGALMLVGGVESMSRAPFVVGKAEAAYSRAMTVFDSAVGVRFPNPEISAAYGDDSMPQTADNLAIEYGITREHADNFAHASQEKYREANERGWFDDERTAIDLPAKGRRAAASVVGDEHPRSTTVQALASLRTLNAQGVTTAGNASGINDGAAALLVGNSAIGERLGLMPLARIVSSAVCGVPPRIMGIGPVPATVKALARAQLDVADLGVIEINEAFAAQALACMKGLGMSLDDERVNPNGGAIALGHPLGASGVRLALTASRQLHTAGEKYAVATMCIGVGQGISVVLERC